MLDERYHVTTSLLCNNRCVFCMEGDHSAEDARRGRAWFGWELLDAESLGRQLEGMARVGPPVLFTGGEPTVNPGLPGLVALVRSRGHERIALQTNGRRLAYAAYLRSLVEAGIRDIGISLHGSSPGVHEAATRAPGSFLQTMAGLKNTLELKAARPELRLRVTTHTTVSRINLKDLPFLLRRLLAGFEGIDAIVLNPLILEGNAARNASLIAPTYTEVCGALRSALDELRREGVRGLSRVRLIDVPRCVARGLEEFMGAFESVLYVNPGGDVAAQGAKQDFAGGKGPSCGACRWDGSCTGISPLYAEAVGWGEFVPC